MHRDITFAFRQLRTNLRFSVIVVLTLALGIGATTAIFSVVSGVLLRALPFPEPERIVSLETIVYPHAETATSGTSAGVFDDVSFPDFFDWQQESKTLEAVASVAYGTTRKFTPAGLFTFPQVPGHYRHRIYAPGPAPVSVHGVFIIID